MLARRAFAHGGTPTTPTTASIIGGMQAQEVVKLLHNLPALLGKGVVFEGALHDSYQVSYPINPDCPWHDDAPSITKFRAGEGAGAPTLLEIWNAAEEMLGGVDALELSREIVEDLACVSCGDRKRVLRPIDAVSEASAVCAKCGGDSTPNFIHSIARGSDYLAQSAEAIGLPRRDSIFARRGERFHGFELGDF